MGWKSSLVIHLAFWFYLLVGGLVFYYLENPTYHLSSLPNKRNKWNIFFLIFFLRFSSNYSSSVLLNNPVFSTTALYNQGLIGENNCGETTRTLLKLYTD